MADLSEIQAAQAVKIVGSDNTGAETTPVNSSANGELRVSDVSNNGGTQAALTIGTTAVEAKVGASPLTNRKSLTIYNNSGNTLYWGYTSGVTVSNGTPLLRDSLAVFEIGTGTSIFLVASNTGNNVRITESA